MFLLFYLVFLLQSSIFIASTSMTEASPGVVIPELTEYLIQIRKKKTLNFILDYHYDNLIEKCKQTYESQNILISKIIQLREFVKEKYEHFNKISKRIAQSEWLNFYSLYKTMLSEINR